MVAGQEQNEKDQVRTMSQDAEMVKTILGLLGPLTAEIVKVTLAGARDLLYPNLGDQPAPTEHVNVGQWVGPRIGGVSAEDPAWEIPNMMPGSYADSLDLEAEMGEG